MAMTTLGSKTHGSTIKIPEGDGTAVFYVAKHDYESELNGTGRTLVVRRYAHTAVSVKDIPNFLADNGTYMNSLSANLRSAIGKTWIKYSTQYGQEYARTKQAAVFHLSSTELGRYNHSWEGTALPIANTLLDFRDSSNKRVSQITRSYAYDLTPGDLNKPITFIEYDNIEDYEYKDRTTYDTASTAFRTRPTFTLPADTLINSDGVVCFNDAPTITSGTASGSDLGTKDGGFDFAYVVNDEDGDAVTVKEYLDGTVMRTYTATLGATNTFECVTAANYQKILNGTHTLKIVANDGKKDSDEYTVTFSKKITTATVTLANALEADDLISIAVVAVLGEIPADAVLQVLVTNNANDTEPVWEDATSSILAGANHVFTNQTAANGFAFNFRLTVTRGESDTGGYITGIGGAFQ